MPALKNQHFVPKCVLKPFTLNGEGRSINLYNIRHDRAIPRAPVKGQCARNYMYGKDGKIEANLSKIEGAYGMTRNRLLDGAEHGGDLHDLNFFTYLQYRRTEIAAHRLKEAYQMMNETIWEGQEPRRIPTDHMLLMQSLDMCLKTRRYIDDLKVRVIKNHTDIDFVTSDDPAIFTNRFADQKLGPPANKRHVVSAARIPYRAIIQWAWPACWSHDSLLKFSTSCKRTVDAHVNMAMKKLGANNRTHAVAFTLRDRIVAGP
jgi:hypothetical protein